MPKTEQQICRQIPLRKRTAQGFLSFFWVMLIPVYLGVLFFLLKESFIVDSLGPVGALVFIPVATFFAWRLTFWSLCHQFPKLYPFQFLIWGYTSKRLWIKPPLCFYTDAFQKDFKELWMPYFKTFRQGSSYEVSGCLSSKFDLSPRPTFTVNPGSATNMAMNHLSQINGDNFQHFVGEYR